MQFLVKKYVFSMFQSFYNFSRSMHIDNNFLITISGDSTTYLLLSVYFTSKIWILSILVKMPIFTSRKVCN